MGLIRNGTGNTSQRHTSAANGIMRFLCRDMGFSDDRAERQLRDRVWSFTIPAWVTRRVRFCPIGPYSKALQSREGVKTSYRHATARESTVEMFEKDPERV